MTAQASTERVFLTAERRAEAARRLLEAGLLDEAKRLGSEAFDALAPLLEGPGPARSARDARALARAAEARVATAGDTWAQAWALLEGHRVLARSLAHSSLSPATLRKRERHRLGGRLLAAVVVACSLALALDLRPGAHATASSVYKDNPLVDASRAVDGDLGSEWLSNDGQNGTLDIHYWPARDVRSVVVHNGHNRWHRDRAVRSFRIELMRDGALVKRLDGAFAAIARDSDSLALDTGVQPDIDRVRLVVLSHHGLGAALAELSLE